MSLIAARSVLFALALAAVATSAMTTAAKAGEAAVTAPPPDGVTSAAASAPGTLDLAPPRSPPPTTNPVPATPERTLAPIVAPIGIENATASLRVGLLLQPQYQSLGETTFDGQGQNLFVRRARFIVGGTLLGAVDYFFDTDYPNLFYARAAFASPTVKYIPALLIQDAFVTYRPFAGKYGDPIVVDTGYFLPPMAHNAIQSAASLLGWDYFAFTFEHDEAFGSQLTGGSGVTPQGRDTGVQLRGLLLGGHLEYRLGAFQGLRSAKTATDVASENKFRFTGRMQINFLDAETGFFYAGTYLGAKRILSIGGSYDFQDSLTNGYLYYAGDAFLDLPVGPGVVTAQINVAHWDGHMFIPTIQSQPFVLQSQTAVMGEAGFTFFSARLTPIVRFEDLRGPALPAITRTGGGVAFWPFGHNWNLKAFYTRITQQSPPPPSAPFHAANQFNLQAQLYFF